MEFACPGVRVGNVVYRDQIDFERKVSQMRENGPLALQLVSDFDFTISKYFLNGVKGITSYDIVQTCVGVPDSFQQELKEIHKKYYEKEVDSNLTSEEKAPLMLEWWNSCHNLMLQCDLTQEHVQNACNASPIQLREKTDELFSLIALHSIPTLVFSAGMATVIEILLRTRISSWTLQHETLVQIIGNRMTFDATTGTLQQFSEPVIHVFNKKASAIPFERQASQGRRNVILFGDSLGDLTMDEGILSDCVIKIGFLNLQEEKLSQYLSGFDLVLLYDGDFGFINNLIQRICT